VEVRRFGSTRCHGNGSLKRLLSAIAAGGFEVVILLARWLGHPASERVRAACRAAHVRCHTVAGGDTSAMRELEQLAGLR
jgi:hypothetical protein